MSAGKGAEVGEGSDQDTAYGQFAYVYDRLMEDTPYPLWLEFAEALWAKFGKPRTVVDLGCGTGSLSIPLAAKGYQVTGIDLSEDMLAVARSKAEQLLPAGSSPVLWLQQDIREWELSGPVDAVISFCDCFNYLLDEEDVVRGFEQTYESLKSGGIFIFDVHTPNHLHSYIDNSPFILNEDDIAYIWTSDLDEDSLLIEHDLTIFARLPDDERYTRIVETHRQRAYPLAWIEASLRGAGFREIECFADFTFDAPGPASERAFFAAIKR